MEISFQVNLISIMNPRFSNCTKKFFFYLPGSLSLLLLLPLFMFWLCNHNAFDRYGILEVSYYDAKDTSKYAMPYPPRRKFSTIDLTGEKIKDKIKIGHVRTQIKNLVSSNDTTTGVKIHFNNISRYESFIDLLNICQKEPVEYLLHDSDMWIFKHHSKSEKSIMGCCVCTSGYTFAQEPTHSQIIPFSVKWPSGILYLTLIIFSIKRNYIRMNI